MTSRKKILIVHNYVTPYRLPVFESLANEFDTTVYFCQAKEKRRHWYFSLDNYSFKHRILPVFELDNYLINYTLTVNLLKDRFDLYIVGENPENLFATFIIFCYAKLFRKRFIIWSEETLENELARVEFPRRPFPKRLLSLYVFLIRLYRSVLYRFTDVFVAYSQKARQYLASYGVPSKKIFKGIQLMPSELIPKPSISKSKTEYKNKVVILSLGYLRRGKGLDFLIRAYKGLSRGDTVLIIAGSGPDEERLKKMAHGRDDIKFVGHAAGIETANWYSIADIFVLPTLHDAWGMVINEAMEFGLPVIVSDSAGATELIEDGKNGYVVRSRDSAELRDRLQLLIDNEGMRKQMSKRSKVLSKHLTVERAVEPFIAAIDFALTKSR